MKSIFGDNGQFLERVNSQKSFMGRLYGMENNLKGNIRRGESLGQIDSLSKAEHDFITLKKITDAKIHES